jgi:elongation factor G
MARAASSGWHAGAGATGGTTTSAVARSAKPIILEPIMDVEVIFPEEFMGAVVGDLNARRGKVMGIEPRAGVQVMRGQVPLGNMFGYSTDLRSATQGRATYTMQFDHYEQVPQSIADEIIGKAKGAAGKAPVGSR